MTVHSRSIKDAVAQMSKTFGQDVAEIIYCTVEEVDIVKCTCTCTPISGKAVTGLENVLLKAEANDGFMLVPSVGSTVVVGLSSITKIPFVMMFEDIDQVLVKINDTTFSISDGITEFNGGVKGGIPNVIDLTTKLNNLENKVNAIISAYNTHIHPTPSGASSQTVSTISGTLTPTNRGDIEDTTVTH